MFEKLIAAASMAFSNFNELAGSEPISTQLPMTESDFKTHIDNNISYPGDYCCRLYKGYNWNGNYKNFCMSETADYKNYDLKTYGYNNNVSSYYCGQHVHYNFCNTRDQSTCASNTDSNSGAGTHMSPVIGNNDFMSTLQLRPYDIEKNAAVTLFMIDNCQDKSGAFFAPDKPYDGSWKSYSVSELPSHNVLSNGVNSIMVPPNLTAILYDGSSFNN